MLPLVPLPKLFHAAFYQTREAEAGCRLVLSFVQTEFNSLVFVFHQFFPFVYQSKWGKRVHFPLLAAVLAAESLRKTEICSGSGKSHDQIKSSQVSSREPIHSHHKTSPLWLHFVSLLLATWFVLGTEIPPLSINPPLVSVCFSSLTLPLLSSLWVFHGAPCGIYFQTYCCEMHCLLILRRDLVPFTKSYVHWGVLHSDSWYQGVLGHIAPELLANPHINLQPAKETLNIHLQEWNVKYLTAMP